MHRLHAINMAILESLLQGLGQYPVKAAVQQALQRASALRSSPAGMASLSVAQRSQAKKDMNALKAGLGNLMRDL